jgi:hypothetical protein
MIKILFVLLSVENIYLCMSKSPRQKRKLKLKVTKRGKRNTKGRRTRLSNNRKVTMKKKGGGDTLVNAATSNANTVYFQQQQAMLNQISAMSSSNSSEHRYASALRIIIDETDSNLANDGASTTSSNISLLSSLIFGNDFIAQGISKFLKDRNKKNEEIINKIRTLEMSKIAGFTGTETGTGSLTTNTIIAT